jgi:hypothetical protein
VSEERDKELFTARPPPGTEGADVYTASTVATQAPADLLDLVRSAEESATVATKAKPPTSATKFHVERAVPAPREEFVDVGEEAVDAPPSLPPIRLVPGANESKGSPSEVLPSVGDSTPPQSRTSARRPSPRTSAPQEAALASDSRAMSPAASILIMLALAIGALLLFTR